jgi:hypothetical protein
MSEQDRLRAKLAHEYADKHAPALAEQMYQVDKGYRHAKLNDLLTDSSSQAYLDIARATLVTAFLGASQRSRITTVQSAIAQHHAIKEDENETVMKQAREDVAKHGVTH